MLQVHCYHSLQDLYTNSDLKITCLCKSAHALTYTVFTWAHLLGKGGRFTQTRKVRLGSNYINYKQKSFAHYMKMDHFCIGKVKNIVCKMRHQLEHKSLLFAI